MKGIDTVESTGEWYWFRWFLRWLCDETISGDDDWSHIKGNHEIWLECIRGLTK